MAATLQACCSLMAFAKSVGAVSIMTKYIQVLIASFFFKLIAPVYCFIHNYSVLCCRWISPETAEDVWNRGSYSLPFPSWLRSGLHGYAM